MKAVEPYQNKVRLQAGNDCADREIQRLCPASRGHVQNPTRGKHGGIAGHALVQ